MVRGKHGGSGRRANTPGLHFETLPRVFVGQFNSQLNLGFNHYPK